MRTTLVSASLAIALLVIAAPVARTGTVMASPCVATDELTNARTGVVTFAGPRGATRRVAVSEHEMRDFVRGLRPGEEMDITYADALAVQAEPAMP